MKKNKMMRIASVLLIVTLLSTCAISGTFAKYVVKGTGEAEAQVARWGIKISMDGDTLFSNKYVKSDTGRGVAVLAKGEYDVVAPGTNSDEAGSTFSAHIENIDNKATEVAVRYALGFTDFTDIVLEKGTVIKDETGLYDTEIDDTTNEPVGYPDLEVREDYSPVKFSIYFLGTIQGNTNLYDYSTGDGFAIVEGVSLTDFDKNVTAGNNMNVGLNGVNAYVDGTTKQIIVDAPAGMTLNGDFICKWEWKYETGNSELEKDYFDKLDTYLGNHPQTLSFGFEATATQID